MMKKILPLLIGGILVFSGLGAATTFATNEINENSEMEFEIKNFNLDVSNPTFEPQDEFITIELDQSEAFMSTTGDPMLPVITKTFDFPVGTTINSVNVDIDWERYDLDRKVTPTPLIVPNSVEVNPSILEERKFNEDVYSSAELYPAEQYSVRLGAGLKDMEHVIFVNVKCYPQYSPANNYVNIPSNIDIDIEYATAEAPVFEEQYDLIIVTHEVFEDELQPLVQHKEGLGITTKLVTVDEIYEDYASESEHDFEQIKMYLADHVLDWDTKFVLLAGGHIGNTYEWYVPEFQSNNWDPTDQYGTWDQNYACDLYYSDIYYVDQFGKHRMDDWDSNNNGIYAEGDLLPSGTDTPDYYPDVMLGRLPMIFEWEADVAVDKIINYENMADNSWFYKAILAGGDGFPPERYPGVADPGIYEGEIVCDAIAKILENRDMASTKCYCSDAGDIKVNGASDIYNEVSKGCGFVHMDGHSCPFSLGSYEPDTGISPEPPLTAFYNGFDARLFDCGYKLPLMINEGCHNAQFDVIGQELIDEIFGAYDLHPDYGFKFYHYEWIPHDVSSWFVLQEGGGAIGVIGNTALGSGYINNGITHGLGGWLMIRYAQAIADGAEYTGSVYNTGINSYIDNFDVYSDPDRIRVEEQVLLGDPSVKLGGYGSSFGSDDSETTEENYGPVSIQVPTWSVGNSWTYALDNIDIDLSMTEDRAVTLKLSSGDIKLEITDVTSNSYIASLTAGSIDVTFGGMFDFHVEDVENINIPTISFDNIQLDGEIIFDKETLGINDINLGLNLDLMENLDNFGIEFPSFAEFLRPFMEIPLNIDVNLEFKNSIELLDFPLENDNIWGIPANTITVTIDGSSQSFWLRLINFVNKFIEIVPPDFAKYLPNIDVSDILNDLGIESTYQIDMDEIPAKLLAYHKDTTACFEVIGSESINTKAGLFNAAKISIAKDNGKMYYSESEGNIVKIIGHVGDYVPIIEDLNLELIG
jgi:hypothetical protein